MKKVLFSAIFMGLFTTANLNLNAQISQADTDLRAAFKRSYEAEAAIKYTKAIEELSPFSTNNSYAVNIRLGYLNYMAAKLQEASNHYTKCIELSPKSVEARLGMVNVLAAQEKWDDVINQYKEILKADAGNVKALYNLSLIYFYRSDYSTAQGYLNSYLALYPFDFDGVNLAGWSSFYQEKKEEAYAYFKKALLLNPSSTLYDKVLNIK